MLYFNPCYYGSVKLQIEKNISISKQYKCSVCKRKMRK